MVKDYIKNADTVIIDIATGLDNIEVYRGPAEGIPPRLLKREVLHKRTVDGRLYLTVKTWGRRYA